jgi:predicted transcriptional regulator
MAMLEITNYINNDFKPFDSKETIESIQNFFADLTFSHFPVVEEGIYIGSIAADDVITFDNNKNAADYRYTLEGFYARNSMIWLDVLEVFAQNNSNLIPVLDDKNNYLGYYELNDIVKFFAETPFLREQGGIIIVKKTTVDFSMSQISQIIETNNGKILGLFISDANGEFVEITIKLSLGGMNEIIQTFRRFNYEIISDHQEDNYLNNLKERSDYLDKYLNI